MDQDKKPFVVAITHRHHSPRHLFFVWSESELKAPLDAWAIFHEEEVNVDEDDWSLLAFAIDAQEAGPQHIARLLDTDRKICTNDTGRLRDARNLVKFFIAGIARSGKLQEAALDQKAIILQLVLLSPMREWVEDGSVTFVQIERWVMETISREAKSQL